MPNPNFPRPTYNRIIDTDPMIMKAPGAAAEEVGGMGWGSRVSLFGHMGTDPKGQNSAKPTAPEMTISHVKGA